VQTYDYSIRLADSTFQKNIEEMRCEEEAKHNRLPESLQSSKKAEDLEEAEAMLEALLENAGNILEELDEILSSSGFSSVFSLPAGESEITSGDKKNVRFQALLPSSLVSRLKKEATLRGLSMNEIVNRALLRELTSIGN